MSMWHSNGWVPQATHTWPGKNWAAFLAGQRVAFAHCEAIIQHPGHHCLVNKYNDAPQRVQRVTD